MVDVRLDGYPVTPRHKAKEVFEDADMFGVQQGVAVNSGENLNVAGKTESIRTRFGNPIPRPILPSSLAQESQFQQAALVKSPDTNTQQQLSQIAPADERFVSPYRPDAGPRMYPIVSGYPSVSIAEKPEDMAAVTQAALGPQLSTYQSQQGHSPTSVTSPSHPHARQIYAPAMPQQNYYYSTYIPHSQSHYGYNPAFQHPSLSTHQQQYNMSPYQQTHHLPQPQSPPQHYPANYESVPAPKVAIQRSSHIPSSGSSNAGRASQHGQSASSGSTQTAAPGPIRATTPTVVKQDQNGVTFISFEYSKDRVKRPYEIRCDVENVDLKKLSKEHKDENCVYPRACSGETYRGNRWQYENECNEVAWALAYLNPELKGKRGLIQRAVDSWRNSNRDKKLRSRRVRRLAKTERRAKMNQLQQEQQQYQHNTKKAQAAAFLKRTGSGISNSIGVTNGITQPDSPSTVGIPQYHHHVVQGSNGPQIGGIAASGTSYGDRRFCHAAISVKGRLLERSRRRISRGD